MPERLPKQERPMTSMHGVSRLLDQWSAGEPEAMEGLLHWVNGELSFLGGMSSRGVAGIPVASVATVERDWPAARLWSHRRLLS